jgi:hypothetical protein
MSAATAAVGKGIEIHREPFQLGAGYRSVKWLFTKCGRYEVSLSLLAAGALTEIERAKIETHVAKYAACRAKLAELQNLAHGLSRVGQRLPEVEAPLSLRRRWMTAVRESARQDREPLRPLLPIRLSSRRLAWGSLAAMWVLVLFFRFSAPDAPRPVSVAAAPASFRELLTALKVDQLETRPRSKGSPPDALPPRSQRPSAGSAQWEAA